MGDPQGKWVTRGYLMPLIQQAYEDLESCIKNASGKNLEAVIEVLEIPPGTSSLFPYQQWVAVPTNNRGPLFGLSDPLKLWAKTAGQQPQFYTLATGPRDTLPHVNPPGLTPGTYECQVTWAWIGNQLSITPVAGPVDVQVYGRFNAPPLVSDSDRLVLYPKMTAVLSYAACSLVGVERSNPAVLQGYMERATAMTDNIVADIIRQSQANPRRVAIMCDAGGYRWGWGTGSGWF